MRASGARRHTLGALARRSFPGPDLRPGPGPPPPLRRDMHRHVPTCRQPAWQTYDTT
ncbi:hypothetical protein KPATCC21470_8621 [Kitasatospora purpeofusca]